MYDFSNKAINLAIDEAMEGIEGVEQLKEKELEDPKDKIIQVCNNYKIKASHRDKIIEKWENKWERNSNGNTMFGVVNSITNAAKNLNQDDKLKLEQTAGKLAA